MTAPALVNAPDVSNFISEATVCCIFPRPDGQPHTICIRTHGVYNINHPKENERYALTRIPWKRDYADVGDYDPAYTRRSGIEKRKEFIFDAKTIAEDCCHQINDNAPGDHSFFGAFVCQGSEPTELELEKAEERLRGYFQRTVAAADASWSNNPRHDLISGVAKYAAKWLKLVPEDHPWMSNISVLKDCPVCGERIKPGVAVCRSCGAILDREKAAKYGLIDEPTEPAKRRGRPPKQQEPQPSLS